MFVTIFANTIRCQIEAATAGKRKFRSSTEDDEDIAGKAEQPVSTNDSRSNRHPMTWKTIDINYNRNLKMHILFLS